MLLLLSLFIILCTLCGLFKRRFEILFPTFAGISILLCYGLAWGKWLWLFPFCIYALGLLCLGFWLWCLLRKEWRGFFKTLLQCVVTPGFFAFLFLAILFSIALSEHMVYHTDDFHYWAVEVKGIWANQGLVDHIHHLSPRFMTYTPGMQLFQWIGLQVTGEFSEGMLFIMLALFYAVYLLPFAQKITWRNAYYLPLFLLFAIVFPSLIFRDSYHVLRVDCALGICFSCAIYQAWTLTRQEKASYVDCISLAVTLSVLVLIKQIGVVWAVLAFSLLPLFGRRKSLSFTKGLLILAIPAVTFGSWLLFSRLSQLSGMHVRNLEASFSSLFSIDGIRSGLENFSLLPAAIGGAIIFPNNKLSILPMSLLGWTLFSLLFLLALVYLLPKYRRTLWKVSLTWGTFFLLGLIGFAAIMLTALRPEFDSFITTNHGNLSYLMERYIGALLAGGLAFCVSLCLTCDMPKRFQRCLPAFGVIFLVLFAPWQQLQADLLLPFPDYDAAYEALVLQEENFWTEDVMAELENPLEAVILYGVNPTPMRPERLQYAVAPLKIRTFYNDMSEEDMIQYFQYHKVTHVLTIDDANPTHETASLFTEDGYIEPYLLYEILWEEEDYPLLIPAY